MKIDKTHTRFALIMAGAFGLLGLGYVATSKADHVSVAQPGTEPAAKPRATLALGYQPKDEPRIAAAQAAVRRHPESADAHAQLAIVMLQRKRETADAAYLQYAIDAIDAARAIDAEASNVLVARCLVAHENHRFVEARELASKLVAKVPDEPTGHLLLGDAHLELGDYDAALKAYQRALDLRPDLRSYNRAAHLRWLHGDAKGAMDLLELAIEAGSPRDPESMAWCFVDLGDIYREHGDAERALRAARRALELVPDYRPALVLEAQAHLLAGDAASARRPLERAVKRHPRVQDLLLLAEISDAKQRDALVRRAEALAEDDPRPMALYYARHAVKAKRAVELAERELEARHGIEAHAVHALALVRAGRHAEAERAIDRALALGTEDADLHLYRALARWAAGDREGAVNALSRALEINPVADSLLATELSTKLSQEKRP